MPSPTLTEQRLCRMWSATEQGGDWFELNKTLHQINMAMHAAADDLGGSDALCKHLREIAAEFSFCAAIALRRAVDEITARKMKVTA